LPTSGTQPNIDGENDPKVVDKIVASHVGSHLPNDRTLAKSDWWQGRFDCGFETHHFPCRFHARNDGRIPNNRIV